MALRITRADGRYMRRKGVRYRRTGDGPGCERLAAFGEEPLECLADRTAALDRRGEEKDARADKDQYVTCQRARARVCVCDVCVCA